MTQQKPTPLSRSARVARAMAFTALAWALAVPVIVETSQEGPASEVLRPAPAIVEVQKDGPDPHALRSQDEATSATAVLQKVEEEEGKEGVLDFDDLRATKLNMEPPPIYPDNMKALDGEEVTIRGFMTPFDSLTDMRNFMLFPYATGCFFCAPPSPREVVFVRINAEKPVEFINAPIEIKGTLSLWKDGSEDSAHESFLYVVNDAKVRELKG